jgi:hypothetical protein
MDLATLVATLALSIGLGLGACRVMLRVVFFAMTRSAFHASTTQRARS